MANSDIKESWSLPLPESRNSYVQLCIRGRVSSPIQNFSSDVLQSSSASKSLISFWRRMINPLHLHIVTWSTLKMSPQKQTEGLSGTSQWYLSFTASLNSLLFKSKFISLIGIKVRHLEAPFWAARSTVLPESEPFASSSFNFRYWFFTGSISL